MASTLITPRLQILTDDGLPLSAGKVYTYEANTNTPLVSYTDATETTQNANPVILDSAGRASIWLSTTTKYKITVKDSNDDLIYTEDDISGAGGSLSSLVTAGANIDMNGYSIITNTNKDLAITPHGTGKLKLSKVELQTNLETNGNDIQVDDLDSISASTGEVILQFGVTASAVNYIKLSNSATSNDVKLEALGTDTNIGMTLLPKGTGTVNVDGTTNYEEACTSDDDLVNKKYVDDIINTTIATASEVRTGTSSTNLMTPGNINNSKVVAGAWGVVTFSGSTPTLEGSHNVTSITDQGVGDIDFNLTNSMDSIAAVVASCEDQTSVAHQIAGGSSSVISIGLYDIDGSAAIDSNFSMIAMGGQSA